MLNSGERELRLYRTADGRIPFSDWLESLLDERTKQKMDARLARVRLGNVGDCKSLGGGVYELRIDFGPGFRIYFGEDAGRVIILLCGGNKSSQQQDIRKSRMYWADYKRRRE